VVWPNHPQLPSGISISKEYSRARYAGAIVSHCALPRSRRHRAPRQTPLPLADSTTEPVGLAVIGTPSCTRRHRTPPAPSPAFQAPRSTLFTLFRMSSPARYAA
jgi:hypothetical protein